MRPALLLWLSVSLTAVAHEMRDMALVGAHDLSGRSAYQPVIQRQGTRWIAYVGHHGGSATNPVNGRIEPAGGNAIPASPTSYRACPGGARAA